MSMLTTDQATAIERLDIDWHAMTAALVRDTAPVYQRMPSPSPIPALVGRIPPTTITQPPFLAAACPAADVPRRPGGRCPWYRVPLAWAALLWNRIAPRGLP